MKKILAIIIVALSTLTLIQMGWAKEPNQVSDTIAPYNVLETFSSLVETANETPIVVDHEINISISVKDSQGNTHTLIYYKSPKKNPLWGKK